MSESDLETWKHFGENGMVGGRFLLYAAVSQAVLRDVERLAETQIYTAIESKWQVSYTSLTANR